MDTLYVGIDVSKDRLDVHVHPDGEVFVCARNADGLDDLITRLKSLDLAIVAIEATGGYETVAAAALGAAGLPVVVVNPAQVRAFARALGARAKTDPIDAGVIARFAEAIKPKLRTLPDAQSQLLAGFVARRRQIIQMMTAEKQRLQRVTVSRLKRSLTRLIKALEKELAIVDQDIDDAVRSSPVWREREDLLKSVPGAGDVTARTIIAGLPEIGRLDRREIASLAGLAPYTQQSGKWRGKSFIGGGRSSVRACLFMAAMVACRHNPVLRLIYQRMTAEGKPKKVAIIAVARKLLVILNSIIRTKTPWKIA